MVDEMKTKKQTWYDMAWSKGMKLSRNVKDYRCYINMLGIVDKSKYLLDIGCGDGKFLSYNPCHCTGIDISKIAVELARNNAFLAEIINTGIENFKYDIKFDYITALGSIEHSDNISLALQSMINLGHCRTKYLVVVPNKDFVGWRLRKIGTAQVEIGEKMYSLKEWKMLLEAEGFRIDKIRYDRGRSWMKLLMWAIPLRYTYQFVFLMSATTKPGDYDYD